MTKSKKMLKRVYGYEVTTGHAHCTYLIKGKREARSTRRMFTDCNIPAFARKAFTSPIHNGKKPKK